MSKQVINISPRLAGRTTAAAKEAILRATYSPRVSIPVARVDQTGKNLRDRIDLLIKEHKIPDLALTIKEGIYLLTYSPASQ